MRIGFIGAGNMGGAIIRGYAASEAMKAETPDELFVYDNDPEKTKSLSSDGLPVKAIDDLGKLTALCETLILCVKPNIMDIVLDELKSSVGSGQGGKLYISIAAGISVGHIKEKLGADTKVIRVMPNTPAMVGEGMSAMSASDGLLDSDKETAERLFGAVGMAVWVPESEMDIVTGISGSSPAYAYMYIDGLVRAGVEGGLSKETATILAAQSTLGAAKMVLENLGEVEPGQLCINVCSPGGTTIEAVIVLEEASFSELVTKAAQASAAKSKLMTK